MTDAAPAAPMNYRFAEYVTSGAFTLALSRRQVTALADIVNRGGLHYAGSSGEALERKGLVERIADPDDFSPERHQYRATYAGLLCAKMVGLCGLAKVSDDPAADEVAALTREAEDRRLEAQSARLTARSALARLDAVTGDLAVSNALLKREKLPVRLTRRDPMPDLKRSQLDELAAEAEGTRE